MIFINNVTEVYNKLLNIKKLGYVKSCTFGPSAVGLTLEKLLGIKQNNSPLNDINQVEIKSFRKGRWCMLTLLSCKPSGPSLFEITNIVENYGENDNQYKELKIFNCSICGHRKTKYLNHYFDLKVDYAEEKIWFCVYDENFNLIDKTIYWKFDELKNRLYEKCKYLALVDAEKKVFKGREYFYYSNINMYKLIDFETFIKLIDNGMIRVCIKNGVYRSGEKKGQSHYRGTTWQIHHRFLTKLFYNYPKEMLVDDWIDLRI